MGRTGLRGLLLLASGLGIALLWSRSEPTPVAIPVAETTVATLSEAPSALPAARKREPAKVVAPRNDEMGADPAAIEKRDAEEREIEALRASG